MNAFDALCVDCDEKPNERGKKKSQVESKKKRRKRFNNKLKVAVEIDDEL